MEAIPSIIHTLHEITEGGQDKLMNSDQLRDPPKYSDLIFTIHEAIDKYNPIINLEKYGTPDMGLANIKVTPKFPNLKWGYELQYGGQRIDYIASHFSEGPWLCSEGRALPFTKYHCVKIIFKLEGNQELDVSYDIVKVPQSVGDGYQYGYKSNGLLRNIYINKPLAVIKLDLAHPTYRIKVRVSKPVNNIYFHVGKECITAFDYDPVKDIWFLNFEETINFSRIDSELRIACEEGSDIEVEYSNYYWNCIVFSAGMAGNKYYAC